MVLDQYLIDIMAEVEGAFDEATDDLQLILDNFQIAYNEMKKDRDLMKKHKKQMDIIKNAIEELDSFTNEGGEEVEIECEDEDEEDEE